MISVLLKQVLNAIVEMEEIPPSFKHSTVIPVFKGKGRDGTALTPIIANILEFITIFCMQPILDRMGVPTMMQTVYASCEDDIFANLETMSHYPSHKSSVHQVMMCAFNLEEAFDTVEILCPVATPF